MTIKFHSAAKKEFFETSEYYEEQVVGLGDFFMGIIMLAKTEILLKICYFTDMEKKKNIEAISRKAMKSQRASFRIEGIHIPKKRADQIRREVVQEFKHNSTLPAS
ncbi:MAG: hypothetical protein WD016_09400 [Balneolaceae bacterium]